MTAVQLPQRFLAKTKPEDRGYTSPCLIWSGYLMPNGYGQFRWAGRTQLAHRVAYEIQIGPIPDGFSLDHLCRNRACVNVEHLEGVTQRENLLRGETVTAAHAAATHCPQGHEYTPENTTVSGGIRYCRSCNQQRMRIRNERNRKARSS
ncbi:HNH endonuclease [Streptomyces spinosirectus]|uniref:HNH endonuclease signature motif containing protein n=1 Tax=Streptomyces TaxID=1883 RepID=UPI001F34C1D7|nr:MULTISPECIES: HNH endonuclease signature motif containing protein [Streptomyces]UIR16696.1 HNH endonuclease [Streptomyces spinosirectus]